MRSRPRNPWRGDGIGQAKRKLLPGLFHLATAGFIPGCRIVGVSLDEIDAAQFRRLAREALDKFGTRPVVSKDWDAFAATLDYVKLSDGPAALRAAVEAAEAALGSECRRLHYLSVPPSAALPAVRLLGEAGLVEASRIVMEKPFGTERSRSSASASAAPTPPGVATVPAAGGWGAVKKNGGGLSSNPYRQ